MSTRIQAIRGMPDILPDRTPLWRTVERLWQDLMRCYGYEEIRFPVLESTALFSHSIGETTDIVEKEMFTFSDRDNESITLRPEGTASTVRLGLEHGLLHNQTQKWWYQGPMFRYERPQKGRYRQFHQMGVEAFGFSDSDIEAEHLFLCNRFWKQLNIVDSVSLQINYLGQEEERAHYRTALIQYWEKHQSILDESSKNRLYKNPLRILDSKNPALQDLIAKAPILQDYLGAQSKAHFASLQKRLQDAGLHYEVNPRLVRGLDYYTGFVYEWVTNKLGAQGAVCAGGRYDGLVERLGGNRTPGVGFAIGVERLLLLMDAMNASISESLDAYLILTGAAFDSGTKIAEFIRDMCPTLSLYTQCGESSLKSQFKKADKSGAKLALIVGDEELAQQSVSIKYLREEKSQESVKLNDLSQFLKKYMQDHRINDVRSK